MFTKKYKPSVKANNELKDAAVKELKAVLYKLEKGRFDDSLNKEIVDGIVGELKEALEGLEYAICTGEENILSLAMEAEKQTKLLKKESEQELTNRIESVADDLVFTLTLWKDVLDGNASLDSDAEIKKEKISRSRKKLNARLAEIETVKEGFETNAKRIDKDIVAAERDLSELESQMLAEDNERKINEIYRKIKTAKSKIDMLAVRKSNYSACFNLLDMILANAKEILNATDYAAEEIAKAKVLLNVGKLKVVMSEPDKAIAILKRMEKDIKEIATKTATIDAKVFDMDSGAATVNEDALKYKEELMRKKREKESLNESIGESDAAAAEKVKKSLKEEN